MKAIAYVDGSFNARTSTYGSGIVLLLDGREPIQLSFSGDTPQFVSARNVAGEVLAASHAICICEQLPGVDELVIYHDYTGIEQWATGNWRASSPIAMFYKEALGRSRVRLSFCKVKAHTGVVYNELADRLAKSACGLA